jgi:hypothetical protein
VSGGWLEIRAAGGVRREALRPGVTRIGGKGADVHLPGADAGELQVWDDPPRFVHVGSGEPPRRDGRALEEAPLRPGDRIHWAGAVLVYAPGTPAKADAAPLEEIELAPLVTPLVEVPPAAAPGLGDAEHRLLAHARAGLALDLGLAERKAAARWRERVVAGAFDPDLCAREILAASGVEAGDPRLVERSGRLLRDFLMAPVLAGARGASRRMRRAARGGMAFVVAQGLALAVFALLVLAALLLLRIRGVSLDGLLDRILRR